MEVISLPMTGRPLRSVQQISNAIRAGETVYCEVHDGVVRQVRASRRRRSIFQVQLDVEGTWVDNPSRVWAAKHLPLTATEASPGTSSTDDILHIERVPVGERTLDELQAMAFHLPFWLEVMVGDWVILPQMARRCLALKQWKRDRTILSAPTFLELVALMREQPWTQLLLDADERTPLRTWHIASPTVVSVDSVPVAKEREN